MITKITDITQYSDLFKKAWNELQARGLFTNEELQYYDSLGNTFTCLEDYFTKLESLMTVNAGETYQKKLKYWDNEDGVVKDDILNPMYASEEDEPIGVQTKYEFIMLPLDEPHLEINANTREINIPAGFKKLVGVEGDHQAETLIFSIDRFFDFMDLLPGNNNMQIYIEWKDKDGQDRAVPVSMIHYDADNGKILFGWPLSSEITTKAGNIKFAVRFFVQDNTVDANGKKKVYYSFSTKPHIITIAEALRPDLNTPVNLDMISSTFLNAIKNSPSTTAPAAPEPTFDVPGKNLESEIDLVDDSAYILKVQAVAEGTGHIQYQRWIYQSEDGTKTENLVGLEVLEKMDPQPTQRIMKEVYYTEDGNIYNGGIPAEVDLYERYYTYTIPAATEPAQDITGTYKAVAINKTGRNTSREIETNACVLHGPGAISFVENGDLPENAFTEDGIAVNTETTYPDKSSVTYEWKYSATSDDALLTKTDLGNANSLSTPAPGWYQVVASATRNRKIVSTTPSTVCRVIGEPADFTITNVTALPDGKDGFDIGATETQELEVLVTLNKEGKVDALCSDELIYEWYAMSVDNDIARKITDELRDTYRIAPASAINTNKLIVYGSDVTTPLGEPIAYYCSVKNQLGTKISNAKDTSLISYMVK